MLPDGIRKASTRKVRRKNHTTSATTMDLVHSQIHVTKERVWGLLAVIPVSNGLGAGGNIAVRRHSACLPDGRQDMTGMGRCVGDPGPVPADPAVGADPDGRAD